MSKQVIVNSNGVNSVITIPDAVTTDLQHIPSKGNFYFNGNTIVTDVPAADTPVIFAYPSGGIQSFTNNHEFIADGSKMCFTYTGAVTKDFVVTTSVDIKNDDNGKVDMSLEWSLNGTAIPILHKQTMQANDYFLAGGNGCVHLSQGDYLAPCVQNLQNSRSPLFTNFNFIIVEF
jgi:hypothetical protein